MEPMMNIWFLFLIKLLLHTPRYSGARVSDIAITNDDNGIIICGSITCPAGTDVCIVKKRSTDDLKFINRKSTCLSSNGTNLAEMNLTEPNPTGTLVNITSSSIIGPSFETRAAAAAPQPASSLLLPPQASPFSSPQQPQPQTINDIISSITNAVAQSATATSASPAQVLPVAVAVPGISSSPSTIVTISAQQPAPQSQTVYTVYPAPPPPPMNYVYTAYVQPPQSNDQILPPLGNVKAAADAIDNAIYTASNYYSYPSWPTPFTAWVYP